MLHLMGCEEEGGGDPTQDSGHEQYKVAARQLQEAAGRAEQREEDARRAPAAQPLGERADKRRQQQARRESAHVQHGNLRLQEAIVAVELVQVGPCSTTHNAQCG